MIQQAGGSGAPRYCPTCEQTFSGTDLCPDDGTRLVVLASPADRLIGSQLDGRYTIKSKLGAGGMGTVYRALQHSVGREVAIKVVNPQVISDPQLIKRFLREAKLTSRLSHPNAVAVLDFGQTGDGLFYLVMELLDGRTLSEVVAAEGALPLPRLLRVASQICDALIGAHRLAIVHRDLKPSNVILLDGPAGRDLLKVLDFGLAKSLSQDTATTTMTGSGAMLGTPAYMSPEAVQGRDVGAPGDLYSLGVILYQLATGRLPFVADTLTALLAKQTSEAPPPLGKGVPPALSNIILRLLAKEPADRFPDAAALQSALAGVDALQSARAEPALSAAERAAIGESETLRPAPRDASLATADTLAPAHSQDGAANPRDVAVPGVAAERVRRSRIAIGAAALAAVGISVATWAWTRGASRTPPVPPASPAVAPPAPDATQSPVQGGGNVASESATPGDQPAPPLEGGGASDAGTSPARGDAPAGEGSERRKSRNKGERERRPADRADDAKPPAVEDTPPW